MGGSAGVGVSVVTPTLNGGEYLQECIDSVRRQTADGVAVEHLLVDDGSTDDTLEIAARNGLRVVPGHMAGLYDAMNLGMREARHRIVCILGSDDALLPGAVASAHRLLSKDKSGWVVGGLRWIAGDGSSLGYIGPPPRWMTAPVYASLGWSCIHHQSTFVTRDFFEDLGGYDANFKVAGDYEFLARALAALPPRRVHAPLACFRRAGTNLSAVSSLVDEENAEVANRFAPVSAWRRNAYRQALRFWLNGRHPGWFLHKRLPAATTRVPVEV